MLIDGTTLSDLEVFRSPDGSDGLFGLIDHTRTTSGRAALKRRLEHPMSDKASIEEVQAGVRFLQEHPDLLWLDEAAVQSVHRYIRSNIEIESRSALGDRLEYLWVSFRFRDVLAELRDGVDATMALFGRLAEVCHAVEGATPPPVVARPIERIHATADLVLGAGARLRNLLAIDRCCRTEAKRAIEESLDALAELDALQAMASSTTALNWTMPQLLAGDAFFLEAGGIVHPFVPASVSNPVRLTGGTPMVFLTGPNMAGKTTYLRSVALVVFLAQVGMGVPAASARLTPVDALFTSLNPSDNLKAGLSYFLAEVMRVKSAAVLLAEGHRALVMFDEVFKGTNVKDALEASAEVILGFARARRSGFIFSSHLAELVATLEGHSGIRFCHFDGEIRLGVPRYSYELKEGVSDKRFGLHLLRQANIPDLIDRIPA